MRAAVGVAVCGRRGCVHSFFTHGISRPSISIVLFCSTHHLTRTETMPRR